jgi:hypothetical protein
VLVLLAYYCVLLERAPRVRWLSGWSKCLLRVIQRNVGPGYTDELKWAKDRVDSGGVDEELPRAKALRFQFQ